MSEKLKIEYLKTDDLIPYINNPKKHDESQVNLIASSIKNFGFINPIIIDKNNEIIAGHGRLLACKKLGIKEVPVIRAEHLTPAQIKAYRIADNRLTELGEWDEELLKIEFEDLMEQDFDLELTGFDLEDIEDIMQEDEKVDVGEEGNIYTSKVDPIVYEPTREEPPEINEMINDNKTKELINKIEKMNIKDKKLKQFLIYSAYRFLEFNYKEIAEFYAHQDKEIQEIMEELALVIIDINKAIQKGFVKAEIEINKIAEEELKELEDE